MLDWGYAQFDVRHRLALSGVWVLPFARGAAGLTKALLVRLAAELDLHRPHGISVHAVGLHERASSLHAGGES